MYFYYGSPWLNNAFCHVIVSFTVYIALIVLQATPALLSRPPLKSNAQMGRTVKAYKLCVLRVLLVTLVPHLLRAFRQYVLLVTTLLEGGLFARLVPQGHTVPMPHRHLLNVHKEDTRQPRRR